MFFRTAVLLERQHRDKGCFAARITVDTEIDFFADITNGFKAMVRLISKDDPTIFDAFITERTATRCARLIRKYDTLMG